MKIKRVDGPPKDILTFDLDVENELNLTPQQVEDVAEIFNTPLTGAYNWDYTVADNRIKKLYELGKELNWNGSMDLNWDYNHPADERIMQADEDLPHETLQAYESLTEKEKIEFDRLCFEASKLYEGDLCEWFHLTNQLLLEVKERIKEGYTKLEMTIKPLEEVVDQKYKDFVGSSKKSFVSHPEPITYGGSCPESIFKANIVVSYVKSSSSQELNAEYEGKPLFVNSELAKEIISRNNIRKLEEKFFDLCKRAKSEESDNNYEQGISPVSYTHLTLPTKRIV